jgi:hypothetical protein
MSKQPEKRALLTVAMQPAELRVVRANARCRGMSMSAMIRNLLARELIDLEQR